MRAFLRAVPSGALALRAVVLVAPVLAVLATDLEGPRPRAVVVALVVLLSGAGALRPESPLLAVGLGLAVAWWALAARDQVPVTTVGAAWLLLSAHLAATLLGYGPRELPLSRALARRWAPRALGLAAAPPTLWLLAVAVRGRAEPTGIWVGGLAAAAVICVTAAVAVRERGLR